MSNTTIRVGHNVCLSASFLALSGREDPTIYRVIDVRGTATPVWKLAVECGNAICGPAFEVFSEDVREVG